MEGNHAEEKRREEGTQDHIIGSHAWKITVLREEDD